MIETILKSKTMLGLIGLLALLIPKIFWVEITEWEILNYVEAIAAWVFAIIAFYWRLTAKWPLLKNEEEEIVYWGAIDWVSDRDWIMWDIVDPASLPKLKRNFDTSKIQYNQNKGWSNNWCTVFAAMWAVSDLLGITRSENQMKDVYNTAVKEWLDPSYGWYTHKAVDLVRKKTKEHFDIEINFATFEMEDVLLLQSLFEKWYSVVGWYLGNWEYNKDKNDDWVISKIHKPTTYGHAVRRFGKRVIDNYFGIKWNVYTNDLVKEMLKAGTLHRRWFVYFIINDDSLLKEKLWIRKRVSWDWVERWVKKDAPKRIRNWVTEVKIWPARYQYKLS